MKLSLLAVGGIVVVVAIATWYISKHYSLANLASVTGVPKATLVAATNATAAQ